MKSKNGFTLIEILVVLVIISITITFAFVAFGDFGAGRKAEIQAEEFSNVIKVIQERALLEGATFGLSLNAGGYQIFRYNPQTGWVEINKAPLASRHFDRNVRVLMEAVTRKNPQIMLHPSGDMTSFHIYFGTAAKAKMFLLWGKQNGDLRLNRVMDNEK